VVDAAAFGGVGGGGALVLEVFEGRCAGGGGVGRELAFGVRGLHAAE